MYVRYAMIEICDVERATHTLARGRVVKVGSIGPVYRAGLKGRDRVHATARRTIRPVPATGGRPSRTSGEREISAPLSTVVPFHQRAIFLDVNLAHDERQP